MQIRRACVGRIRSALALLLGVLIALAIATADARAQATASFEVTSLADIGPGSLREAITAANASAATAKTITFNVPASETILLATPLPDIDGSVTIDGSTATNLAIDGGVSARIFRVGSATTTLRDLALKNAPLEIASGASLSFDTSTDRQFDDVITDAGKLIKDGVATLTLRGANDYTGGTEIRKGTLRGDTTSLQGNITNNAKLVFDQTVNGTYAGSVSGTGSLQKTDTGEVSLGGVNTYSGGTTITGGALRGAVGSLQGNVAVESDASVIFEQPVDATYAGNLSGAGDFTKEGAGTLTLSGSNSISGQANLEVGALKGGFASIPQNLTAAAGTEVIFDHANSGSYAGSIDGMGAVTKIGTGALTLTGDNAYTGVTTVSAGTLRADPGKLPNTGASSIVNNAELIFDASGTRIYDGVISGTGNFTKTGSGSISLTGINSFTGFTSVSAGRLDVDGSLATGVDVGASAVLGGTGSIGGPVTVSGSVAPGNSIGTLSVAAIDFAPGSLFEVEVDASGIADHLIVSGNADLNGASVRIDPGAGSYAVPVNVTILTAGVKLSEFSSFGPDFAFLDITPVIDATTVKLTIVENGMSLLDFAQTPNQSTIATALESAEMAGTDPDIDTVFDSLNVLTVDQVSSALDSMTGESLTQFATARLATAERFGQALGARVLDHQWASGRALIAANSATGESSGASVDPDRAASSPIFALAMLAAGPMGVPADASGSSADLGIRTWVDGSAIYGDVDGNPNESGFDYNVWGGSLGADVRLAERWVLGLAGGYATTDIDFSSRPGDGDIDTYQGAVYAGYVDPRFYLGASGRYAYNDMEGKRQIRFGAINRAASADLDGHDFGARLEGGLNLLDLGGIVFQPTASVNYNRLTQDGANESGAMSLNLALEDFDVDSLVAGAGMRIRARWELADGFWLVPELRGRWLHEFLDTDRLIEAQLVSAPVGASSFGIQGVELPRDAGSVGVAWSVMTGSAWRIVGSYDALLNQDLIQHAASITLQLEW